jgi:hypothetical protein
MGRNSQDIYPEKELLPVKRFPEKKNISADLCSKSGKCRNIATHSTPAQVAELVDAADSKSAVRKNVLVRFQSWAHKEVSLVSIELTRLFFWG